jgi:hypothetical protein
MKMDQQMRILTWVGAMAIAMLMVTGCGKRIGAQVNVTWETAKPAIVKGTTVTLHSSSVTGGVAWVVIGVVKSANPAGTGTLASIGLYKEFLANLTSETVFLYHEGAQDSPGFIEARVLKQEAPPIHDGMSLKGVESDMEAIMLKVQTNWKKTLAIVLSIVCPILILAGLFKFVARKIGIIIGIVGGLAAVAYATSLVEPYVTPHLPQGVDPALATQAVTFVIGFLVCSIAFGTLRKLIKRKS